MEAKGLPSFPGKNRFSSMTAAMTDERRMKIEAWLQGVVKNRVLAQSTVFVKFMKLKPDFDEVHDELMTKAHVCQPSHFHLAYDAVCCR